jgi:6-pyruvoyltetrahydropterin/6-carboxytetrahydropterin synthase
MSVYTIAKSFSFAAAHRLEGLPDEHPCSRMHGHNYTVELQLQSPVLDRVGFVFDYRAFAPFKQWIDERVDHRLLNDVFSGNPTAEHLARDLYLQAMSYFGSLVYAVRVSETPTTWAEYRRE